MKWTDQSPANNPPDLPEALLDTPVTRILCGPEQSPRASLVLITHAVHRRVLGHLQGRRIEQGGLLLGVPFRDPAGKPESNQPSRIVILDCAAAPLSSGTGYSLRMEAAVWGAANERLGQINIAGARIVGWYHSHPGLSAFFSSTDMATQAAFFHHPYSVGWVVDPTDDSHAMFIGPQSNPVRGALVDDQTVNNLSG